nr:MAG: TlpA family protein disulfide reductase [Pseudomonadota bacterium]
MIARGSARRRFVGAALALLALGTACNQEEKRAPLVTRERSQAIQTTGSDAPVAAPDTTNVAAVASSAPAPRPRRVLCDGELRDGKALPKRRVARAAARGTDPKPEPIPAGGGKWTWVNFWAAWCAPCKEEIPRLKSWERTLSSAPAALRVVFVSLDDDERQLRGFLEASGDLDTTYWLREGREREEWMSDAGLGADPELPIHLLVDPKGKIRCQVQGAVEDADLPVLTRLLGG